MFSFLREFLPASYLCWRDGLSRPNFLKDLYAGITIGVISLPLVMAYAIAAGVPPERGLFTGVIAGFLISLLGGSRVQIGGPTGAFAVIIYSTIQQHGYEGLALATLLAGIMIMAMGFARFGGILKFIPYPVTTGFTTAIAVVIFSSQIKDFLGLPLTSLPADFCKQFEIYCQSIHATHAPSFLLAVTSLAAIILLRRFYPKAPGTIIAVGAATAFTYFFDLPIATIESRFGEIPNVLPSPSLPAFSLEKVQAVFPDSISIALLGAIESLLSAVVADGITGFRHRSNCELVGQGLANIGAVFFGGIPATGAIARTTANVNMGAKTPLAGMIHALVLLLLMLLFAPLAAKIPLPVMAAVLVFVAWNMSDLPHFIEILKGQKSDAAVLLVTFSCTLLFNLTISIPMGILLALALFVKRMSDHTGIEPCAILSENADMKEKIDSSVILRQDIPKEIAVFEITGPFFFGIADCLEEKLLELSSSPRVFILRMRKVNTIDATGAQALKQFQKRCQEKQILFLLSSVRDPLQKILHKTGVHEIVDPSHVFTHFDHALDFALSKVSIKDASNAGSQAHL